MDAAFVTWRHEFRRLQSETPQPPEQFVWSVTADVPIDPALHTCLLVYESDTARSAPRVCPTEAVIIATACRLQA